MIIPPAPAGKRRITSQISTQQLPGSCRNLVKAEYNDKREYKRQEDAVCFARLKPAQITTPGGWGGSFNGEIVLHVFEKDEIVALETLLAMLATTGVPVEQDPRPVILALDGAVAAGLDWDYLPMGRRSGKRREPRTKWRDLDTGQRVNIYTKTGKPHADPNCKCARCYQPPPTSEDELIELDPEDLLT